MSDAALDRTRIPLGVGALLGASFAILFRRFFRVALLSFGAVALSMLVVWAAAEYDADASEEVIVLTLLLHPAISVALSAALTAQLAYDARAGRAVGFLRYLLPGLRALLLALPTGLAAVGVAALPFVIASGNIAPAPGLGLVAVALWVCTVLSLVAPAAVVERAGLASLGRSVALSRGYRLPILGMGLLAGVLIIVTSSVGLALVGSSEIWVEVTDFILIPLYAAIAAPGYGFGGIMVALVHARLREIKEGLGSDRIVSVFD